MNELASCIPGKFPPWSKLALEPEATMGVPVSPVLSAGASRVWMALPGSNRSLPAACGGSGYARSLHLPDSVQRSLAPTGGGPGKAEGGPRVS